MPVVDESRTMSVGNVGGNGEEIRLSGKNCFAQFRETTVQLNNIFGSALFDP